MTLSNLKEYERIEFSNALCRKYFREYLKHSFAIVSPNDTYLSNWHIDLVSEYLEACYRSEITRLIINVPPRSLKSISSAVALPTWILGHNPKEQIIVASYAEKLAFKHSLDSRAIVESSWYKQVFPNTRLMTDQNTKSKFMTTVRGFRMATSVDGVATGDGGNFLIVDDAISQKQSESEIYRDRVNRWFDGTFATRLNNKQKGVIIVNMQRFHVNDLTGHLLEKGNWEHLCIPAIETETKKYSIGSFCYERPEGDILHPARMDADYLNKEKITLGTYGFSGQYQQTPTPEGGGEFRKEWLEYYDNVSLDNMNLYIMVDPANSLKKNSDYTAIVVIGAGEDGNLYLVDMIRERMNVREREEIMFKLHRKYKPKSVVYEKYGMQVDSDWIKKSMEERNYRFRIEEVGGILKKQIA